MDRYFEAAKDYIESRGADSEGLIKKYFHLWIGERCKVIRGAFRATQENIARFRIIAVDQYQHDEGAVLPFIDKKDDIHQEHSALYALRNEGIIRLVEADDALKNLEDQLAALAASASEEKWEELKRQQYIQAMKLWLGSWLKGEQHDHIKGLRIQRPAPDGKEETIGVALWEDTPQGLQTQYLNKFDLIRRYAGDKDRWAETEEGKQWSEFPYLNIAHGDERPGRDCRIRNHGVLITDVYEDAGSVKDIASYKFKEQQLGKVYKLIETVLSHITIFDNRLAERFQQDTERNGAASGVPIQDQLRIEAFREEKTAFEKHRDRILEKSAHFLIMHLTFLETLGYRESEVSKFYEQEIFGYYKKQHPERAFPDNFLLVIVSGRGRGDWLDAIRDPRVTFRPIEDLVNAVEDGLIVKDDFQVKYNLCNVLLGA